MMQKKDWKTELANALCDASGMEIDECEASLCQPRGGQADWCSTLAFNFAKRNGQNPAKVAKEWAECAKWPKFVARVDAAGPYINFHFGNYFWRGVLFELVQNAPRKIESAKRIIVEFPSVNPNKPWHAGHLRNAILGDSVANILTYCGHKVQRLDYIDDLGLQVAQSYWGKENLAREEGDGEFAKKTDHECGRQYVEVSKMFANEEVATQVRSVLKEMEEGDGHRAKKAREYAENIVAAQYETAFSLGIFHDALVFESDIVRCVFDEGIEKIKKSGALVYEEEGKNKGCWVIRLEGAKGFEGLENADKILIRSDGTATYTGKDVAFQLWKFGLLKNDFEYCKFITQPNGKIAYKTCQNGGRKMDFGRANIAVNVIGMEQSYPQKAICAVLEKIGYEDAAKNSVHLAYEHVVLPQGKFSGRKGTWMKKEGEELGFSADELVAEVVRRAKERINSEYSEKEKEEIAKAVGIAALRFSLLRASASMKIVFDADRSLSLSGDSGPYIQYAYARAANIVAKADGKELEVEPAELEGCEFSPEEISLLRTILKFEFVVDACQKNMQVHPMCDYALELAGAFNKFYSSVRVLQEQDTKKRKAMLLQIRTYISIMRAIMGILGIKALEKM